jgi:F-type H+-transporting ATPase subunit c
MKKGFTVSVLAFLAVISSVALAAAAEAANPGTSVDYTRTIVVVVSLLVAGGAIAVGTIGTSSAMGQGLSSAANSVGRNPEAHGKILITMMVGLAMIESLAIYCLVVALIVLYANPLLKVIGV